MVIIMKKIVILFITLSMLVGCQIEKKDEFINYEVATIVTTEKFKKSIINYYDSDLKKVKSDTVSYPKLGSHFNQPVYNNEKMYLVPKGLITKYDEKKIAEINLNDGGIKDYDVNHINILNVSVNEKYIYSISNFNSVNYLTQTDKENNYIKEISNDELFYMRLVVCIKDKVCLFEFNSQSDQIQSKLNVYDINLNLLKSIDISSMGENQLKYAVKDNLLFFSNTLLNDQDSNTIGVLNVDDYSLKSITLNDYKPSDLIIYDNHLYVAHTNEVVTEGKKISVINLNNYDDIKQYEINYPIMRMEISHDFIYIMSHDTDKNQLMIIQYSLKDDFKEKNKIVENIEENFYPSVLFVKGK